MRQGLRALPIFSHFQSTLVTRTKSKLATHRRQNSSSCHSHWAGHQAPKWPLPQPPEAPGKPMPFLSLSTNMTITLVRVKAPGPPTFKERSVLLVGLCPMFLNQNNHHKAGACNPYTWEAEAQGLTPSGGQPGLHKWHLVFNMKSNPKGAGSMVSITGAHGTH